MCCSASMLVENPALLLPSASCFCQSGLTTLILTSEALSPSFIWQKPDVAKTDAERWRGGRHLQTDGGFCPKVLAVATGNWATGWASGAPNCQGVFKNLWANLHIRAHTPQDPSDLKSDCNVAQC